MTSTYSSEPAHQCGAAVSAYGHGPPSAASWRVSDGAANAPSPESPAEAPPGRGTITEAVHERMRMRHMSPRTEEAYLYWMRRFFTFHGGAHPATLGGEHVQAFLSALATQDHVTASTQNQALAALIFLYREVYGAELPWQGDIVRARRPARLPTVLSRAEVGQVLERMDGLPRLMATLLYGSGLRLMECCRLRVKDVDFDRREVVVRDGKGAKDRRTMLPDSARAPLRAHLATWSARHQSDVAAGAGWVELPHALDRKYPNAGREWPWQWVFPATRTYRHAESGHVRRHHLHETVLQQAVRAAALAARIPTRLAEAVHSGPPLAAERQR